MNRLVIFLLLLVVAGCSKPAVATKQDADIEYWTCTMHPSVHSKDPGKCPICSMDLVPVMGKGAMAWAHSDSFLVPIDRQQQIGVTYATVQPRELSNSIRTLGIVEPDKRRMWSFVARTDGYIEKLFVGSAGEMVEKGAPLLSLYSPELLTTEKEFSLLVKQRSPELQAASKSRLRQWGVPEPQIEGLEKGGKPEEVVTFVSPFRCVVTSVPANQGASVKAGEALVEVADLSTVWVWTEVYETEIGYLKVGEQVSLGSATFPNRVFLGTVQSIDPSIDPVKRTARARIVVENADFALKPGMYVDAMLSIDVGVHLAVPAGAVLPTGLHNLVFVDRGGGHLEPRTIIVDGKFGDYYAVRSGLAAGDRVVASANFLIDAEAQVQGALKDFESADDPSTVPR